ncbi:MAG: NAD(P)H-hydrate dehydratase [Phycisphaerales bacterium]
MGDATPQNTANTDRVEAAGVKLPRLLPRRPDFGHKGTFGTVSVIGGSAGSSGGTQPMMLGAPTLAARSALRAGAGMARLAVPSSILQAALSLAPETIGHGLPVDSSGETVGHEAAPIVDTLCDKSASIVVGPGLGTGGGARSITLRLLAQHDVPVVVDADALNLLAQLPDVHNDICAVRADASPGGVPAPGDERGARGDHARRFESGPAAGGRGPARAGSGASWC